MFNPGDSVALTATTILCLKRTHPEEFAKLEKANRTGGRVVSVDANAITVDMGDALAYPLIVSVNETHPQLALQLIQRADSAELEPPVAVYDDVVEEPQLPAPVSHVNPMDRDMPSHGTFMGMLPPDVAEGLFNAVRSQRRNASGLVPIRVQTAQWVMGQFIGLKQYTIVQDLHRGPTHGHDDDEDIVPGDEWKHNRDHTPLTRVVLQLDDPERALYDSSMTKIQKWIEQADDGPTQSVALSNSVVPGPVPTPTKCDDNVPDQEVAESQPTDPFEIDDTEPVNGESGG